jgi:hypothetical protein
VLIEKLPVPQLINSSHVIEHDVSLPHPEELATCPYPEPDEPTPIPIPLLDDIIFYYSPIKGSAFQKG